MKRLYESLRQAGKEPVTLGDSILVLPFGGRILGVYPDGEKNMFWVNADLMQADTARSFFAADGWLNTGGDRTWISPEMETHCPDMDGYPGNTDVPGSVDPGAYQVCEAGKSSVKLVSGMAVRFHRSGQNINLDVEKEVVMRDKPPMTLPPGVSFAGYQARCTLRIAEPVSGPMRPGLWNLIQVPGGGEIVIPVKPGVAPREFIGDPVFTLEGNRLRALVETDASFKFSIKAGQSRGSMVYINTACDPASLVVRKYHVGDESRYADFPCNDPGDPGYLTEIYIDDGAYGGFGEMEYHSPAIDVAGGETEVRDSSEVWAFSGPAQAVRNLSEAILRETA